MSCALLLLLLLLPLLLRALRTGSARPHVRSKLGGRWISRGSPGTQRLWQDLSKEQDTGDADELQAADAGEGRGVPLPKAKGWRQRKAGTAGGAGGEWRVGSTGAYGSAV